MYQIPICLLVIFVSSIASAEELFQADGSEFWPAVFGLKLKISDSLLVFFTMVLALFTALLWWSTRALWRASERQALLTKEALIAGQRAWISIALSVDSDFTIHETGAECGVSLRVENIGRSPALRVHTRIEMMIDNQDIPSRLKALCAEQLTPNDSWSRLLLPGESYDRPWGPSVDSNELHSAGMGEYVWPHICGCVSYQVIGDDAVHQTAFVFGLGRGSRFISLDDERTPADEITVTVQTGGFAT